MPTYEYICAKCNARFDLFQSIKEDAITICPKDLCEQSRWGKGKVKRLIGAGAGLIFKGSGFYITDYRSDKYKEAAKKDVSPPSSAPSEGKTSGKSTGNGGSSKPEKKPSSAD